MVLCVIGLVQGYKMDKAYFLQYQINRLLTGYNIDPYWNQYLQLLHATRFPSSANL